MNKIGIIFKNAKVADRTYEQIAVRTKYKKEDLSSGIIDYIDIEFDGLDVYADTTDTCIDDYSDTELFYYA